MLANLGNVRIPIQIDIGFGDAVTPSADTLELPSLLPDLPSPVLRTYPVYTVVAEKIEAMVSLGDFNTRMKDFFDIHFLVTTEILDPEILNRAIRATFERRKTALPLVCPIPSSQNSPS